MKFGTTNFTCEMSIVLKNQPILLTRCRDRALRSQTALQRSKNCIFTKNVMGTHIFGKFRFWKASDHHWYVSVGPSWSNLPGRQFKRRGAGATAEPLIFWPFWTPTLVAPAGDAFQFLRYVRLFLESIGTNAPCLWIPSAWDSPCKYTRDMKHPFKKALFEGVFHVSSIFKRRVRGTWNSQTRRKYAYIF